MMRRERPGWRIWLKGGAWLAVALGVVGLMLSACSSLNHTVVAPPHIEGAEFSGNESCLPCHTGISRSFHSSAHGQFDKGTLEWAGRTGCESCHGPGSKHIAAGGGRGVFIVNPRRDSSVCFQCHIDVESEFHLPQRHPVVDGAMHCAQCHDPHGMDIHKRAGGLAMARLNETCAECHREQARPKVFEHEALREGCAVCHEPHGAMHARLLIERDSNLCLKCHAQIQGADVPGGEIFIGKVPHAAFLNRGTCWSAGCHTAVHGSNISPQLLY